jgi:1,4-dihydroxy-2-naphthoate polyprenyltransferase
VSKEKVRAGLWRLADPKISLASFSGMFLGACAAARAGRLSAVWLGMTVAGIFCLEVAKNASGEVFDFQSGVDGAVAREDRSPFSGGKRVLVDGLLSLRQTWIIAAVSYGAGISAGLVIASLREPSVLWLGLAGVPLAFFYHSPPLKLSYRGFGEAAVAFCYGPLIVSGTYFVQRGAVPVGLVMVSIPLGILVSAFLWINEFPDEKADSAAGKRTLVVRLGRGRAARVFALLVAGAFLLLAALPLMPLAQPLPRGIWGGLVGLPLAVTAAVRLLRAPDDVPSIIPAQGMTLLSFVLLALGSGLGLLAFR